MAELNHFAISAALGSILGPRFQVRPGQIGSSEAGETVSILLQKRKAIVDDLRLQDDLSKRYEKAVTRAYLNARGGFSSDRVLADPRINADFVRACRDLGVDDSPFHLNLALVGLRKHNKLKAKSKRSNVPDIWRVAVASEMAARTMYYRFGISVDTALAHPDFVTEFDRIASSIAPGFTPLQYRWAALNVRKKGSNAKVRPKVIEGLDWSDRVRFDAVGGVPSDEGVYSLFERDTCLFVAGTEDLKESIKGQQTIAHTRFFEADLWRPNPRHLAWQYVDLPGSHTDFRFGIVRSLVRKWQPVFNIPRGRKAG